VVGVAAAVVSGKENLIFHQTALECHHHPRRNFECRKDGKNAKKTADRSRNGSSSRRRKNPEALPGEEGVAALVPQVVEDMGTAIALAVDRDDQDDRS
jgi:hypothetical protein